MTRREVVKNLATAFAALTPWQRRNLRAAVDCGAKIACGVQAYEYDTPYGAQ